MSHPGPNQTVTVGPNQSVISSTTILNHDGPGWLNALVILFTWNAFKMLRIDPVTLVLRRYIRVTRPDRRASTDVHREEAQAHEVETAGASR